MTRFKRFLVYVFTLLTLSCVLVGCNTLKGAGEDIQEGGEAIEDAAD